MEIFSIQFEGI